MVTKIKSCELRTAVGNLHQKHYVWISSQCLESQFINVSPSQYLYTYIMHGQVNGEALPLAGLVLQARPFSFHSTDCFQYWHGCTANAVLWFSFFSPPAISCPSKQFSAFISTTMIYFLFVLFLLIKTYSTNFNGRPSEDNTRGLQIFVAFSVPVQLENRWQCQHQPPRQTASSHVQCRQFHFQSIKVIP